MKRFLLSLAAAMLLAGTGCFFTEDSPVDPPAQTPTLAHADVRGVRWGMTPKEVKASERGTFAGEGKASKNAHIMLYKGRIIGHDCLVTHFFVSGKLGEVQVSIQRQPHFGNKCLEDYDWLKKNLQKKYGVPKSDLTSWSRELYKGDPDRHGFAVKIGDLAKFTKWETPASYITLALFEKDNEPKVVIEYAGKTMKAAMQRARDKARQTGL